MDHERSETDTDEGDSGAGAASAGVVDGLAGARLAGGGGASLVGLAADEVPGLGLVGVVSLRDAADVCEEFQVLRAREAGWSWARIGAVLGVSAQAAHKRHAGRGTAVTMAIGGPLAGKSTS